MTGTHFRTPCSGFVSLKKKKKKKANKPMPRIQRFRHIIIQMKIQRHTKGKRRINENTETNLSAIRMS